MNILLNYKNVLAVAVLLGVFAVLAVVLQEPRDAHGSVNVANEYVATSTASNTLYGATITDDKTIIRGQGVLGSVVITGAGTAIWNLYDATTTDVNLRTGQKATSTILVASFPASVAAGTYTFDVIFNDGLLLDVQSGVMATSTITFRR